VRRAATLRLRRLLIDRLCARTLGRVVPRAPRRPDRGARVSSRLPEGLGHDMKSHSSARCAETACSTRGRMPRLPCCDGFGVARRSVEVVAHLVGGPSPRSGPADGTFSRGLRPSGRTSRQSRDVALGCERTRKTERRGASRGTPARAATSPPQPRRASAGRRDGSSGPVAARASSHRFVSPRHFGELETV